MARALPHSKLLKIISGGQTGVDRGALDAALELGVDCGGWCPTGRLAEDGTIPERYPVVELSNKGYAERTARNVADSDGTLIITSGEPIGGTRETIERCIELQKPYLVIDHARVAIDEAIELTLAFVETLPSRFADTAGNLTKVRIKSDQVRDPSHTLGATNTLNVAGPRASQWLDGHKIAQQIVSSVLRRLSGHKSSDE